MIGETKMICEEREILEKVRYKMNLKEINKEITIFIDAWPLENSEDKPVFAIHFLGDPPPKMENVRRYKAKLCISFPLVSQEHIVPDGDITLEEVK